MHRPGRDSPGQEALRLRQVRNDTPGGQKQVREDNLGEDRPNYPAVNLCDADAQAESFAAEPSRNDQTRKVRNPDSH